MSDQGRFTWFELMSTDPKAALDFYADLNGWTHQKWGGPPPEGMPPMEYNMWMIGEQPIAGCTDLPAEAREQGAPTHWLGYIHCDDVDATRAKAVELGATELVTMQIADVGKFSVMHDPQHAVIAFFQPKDAPGPDAEATTGHFCWHELITTDYEAAFGFYSELFGWEIIDDMDMGDGMMYRMYGRNGKPLGGMYNKPPEVPVASWLYYVDVPNVDESAEAITAAGGKVVMGPFDVPGGGRIVQAMDPQGGVFALHTPPETPADA